MFIEQQISIRVISEGSCDTEDWSNTALQHRKKLYLTYNGSKLNDCCLFDVPVKLQEGCITLHSTKISNYD